MSGTAALPRSTLHLTFLKANCPDISHVLYRDAHIGKAAEQLFPGRAIYLGREGLPPLHLVAALRRIAANRRYYSTVRERVARLDIERLILFLEGEPLERMLTDWFGGPIELWEDGLSHYVDLTSSAWYAARGAVQALCGFYPRGILRRRADRSRMTIRDRFEQRNLILPAPALAPAQPRFLLVGSPLAEDGLAPRRLVRAGVARIATAARGVPVAYLPHPREDGDAVSCMLQDIEGAELASKPWGLTTHIAAHGYAGFVAAVSTGLLDIQAFERSLFLPQFFGQSRMHRVLADWDANPIGLAWDEAELKAFFARVLDGVAASAPD